MGENAACTRPPSSDPRRGNPHEEMQGVKVPAARMVFSDDDRATVLSLAEEKGDADAVARIRRALN